MTQSPAVVLWKRPLHDLQNLLLQQRMVTASAFQLWILVVALVVGLEGAMAQDCNKTFTARTFVPLLPGCCTRPTTPSTSQSFMGMEYGTIILLRSRMPLIAQFSFSTYQPHTSCVE